MSFHSLVISVPSLVLFFPSEKYDLSKSVAQSEKPYALSLFRSSGGCSESNAFDMSVERTPTTFFLSISHFQDSISFRSVVSQLWFRR